MAPRYLLWRLAQIAPAVAGILLIAFVAVHTAPGDPVLALAGEHGDAAYYAFIRSQFGLDRPLSAQLFIYVSRVALGVLAARRAGRPTDLAVRTASLLAHAMPSFWLAQMAAIALALGTGWFPVQGLTDARRALTGWRYALDVTHHLVLPALVLAAGELALTTRLTRTGMLEALATDYARTARAKGLSERGVVRHALRNALLPLVAVVGGRAGLVVTGAVLVETVFAWPGLGQLLLSSIQTRDVPILLGLFLLAS